MGRMYALSYDNIAVSAAQDLLEVRAPADAALRVHSIDVSDCDSETNEQSRLRLRRGEGSVTAGSGGSTSNIAKTPLSKGDAAFGGTVGRNNTTALVAGSGTLVELGAFGFNWLSGFQWLPTPEARIDISPSDYLVVNLPTAPAASRNVSVTILVEEIGG